MQTFRKALDPNGRLVWVEKLPKYMNTDNSCMQMIIVPNPMTATQYDIVILGLKLKLLKRKVEGMPNRTLVYFEKGFMFYIFGFCFELEQ